MNERLRKTVEAFYRAETGRALELEDPRGYNEKLQWLKLYDQTPDHVVCCDKLLVRGHVAAKVGVDCLSTIHQAARSVDRIDFDALPSDFVLKANHDSGTVEIVRNKKNLNLVKKTIRKKMALDYGLDAGEWAYAHIRRAVFAEEMMRGPVLDYKFHCSYGKILWTQIVSGMLGEEARETVVDQEAEAMGLHFNVENAADPTLARRPACWSAMKDIARELSRDFAYVRVDLYDYQNSPRFGELTFWPLSGLCRTPDEPAFGALLPLDTAKKSPFAFDHVDPVLPKRSLMRRTRDWALAKVERKRRSFFGKEKTK